MEDPAGVGAVRTCGTMRDHDGMFIISPTLRSAGVEACTAVAIRGAIRAVRGLEPTATRSLLKSPSMGTMTIKGMPNSLQRRLRRCTARAPAVLLSLGFASLKRAMRLQSGARSGPQGGRNLCRKVVVEITKYGNDDDFEDAKFPTLVLLMIRTSRFGDRSKVPICWLKGGTSMNAGRR